MVKIILLLVVVSLVAIYTAEARKCYQCPNCENIGKDDKSTDCAIPTQKPTKKSFHKDPKTTTVASTTTDKSKIKFYCSTVKYKSIDKDESKVARSCTQSNVCLAPDNTLIESCKICDEDGCNGSGAGSIQGWAFTALIVVALTKLFV